MEHGFSFCCTGVLFSNAALHHNITYRYVRPRCFPPPWLVEELHECLTVKDANGQKLAYVYFEDQEGRRTAAKLLSYNEARRIAANIAKLPELVKWSPK